MKEQLRRTRNGYIDDALQRLYSGSRSHSGIKSMLGKACAQCIFYGTNLCAYTRSYDNNSAGRLTADLINKKNDGKLDPFRRIMKTDDINVPCQVALNGMRASKAWLSSHNETEESGQELDGKRLAAGEGTEKY